MAVENNVIAVGVTPVQVVANVDKWFGKTLILSNTSADALTGDTNLYFGAEGVDVASGFPLARGGTPIQIPIDDALYVVGPQAGMELRVLAV